MGRSGLSARAKTLPIHAIRVVRPPGAGAGRKQAWRCGPPDAGRGEARHSHDGAYCQAFGRKKQARVAYHSAYRRAPLGRCSKGEASRIIPWCEARSERPPLFRRASPPVPSLPLTLRERAAPLGPAASSSLERADEGNPATPKRARRQQPPWGMFRLG